ncbi:unnamed protein product [Somion occarium]|uniref:DUF6535 domain-containing protein n=1 Tax=Somion occarium TaxID=3059160 RepID=A0ABP1E8W4_9APHY
MAMAGHIREVDRAKIEDFKEDIDILLIFAGLFSAVLTAFIIESYKTLRVDPADATVQLLQQISMQLNSFTVNGNYINATIPPPSTPEPFTAALSAVKINSFWFVSLILSLIAASFSMLVKGWLHEYLAIEQTSPQTHFQIRFFALQKWKVFKIAALLPLLLQAALGLFLLGLCFFTTSIHSSIGITSIVLVTLWVALLLRTTLAPAVSSHCPYKVIFLKNALKYVRYIWFLGHDYIVNFL